LDEVMKSGAILASNTSTLDLNKIAGFTRRPMDVVGTHFFSPAHVMKLLEVVRGEKTAKDVLATVMSVAKRIKKTAVVSGVCDGFIGNRMVEQYLRQALFLLEEGATPSQVDSALITQPRAGGPAFRIAEVTAFFLRDLQPPKQVVEAINNKIAQEQQIETERHRVEVARLQSEQQRLLNQTLTAEALTKQYLEVLHDLRNSNNTVILIPTEGGIPLLDIGKLQANLKR